MIIRRPLKLGGEYDPIGGCDEFPALTVTVVKNMPVFLTRKLSAKPLFGDGSRLELETWHVALSMSATNSMINSETAMLGVDRGVHFVSAKAPCALNNKQTNPHANRGIHDAMNADCNPLRSDL